MRGPALAAPATRIENNTGIELRTVWSFFRNEKASDPNARAALTTIPNGNELSRRGYVTASSPRLD
jgi:hypothetical protein